MNNAARQLILLDFDGVLFDTAREAFHIGRSVWPEDAPFEEEELLRRFMRLRPLVGPAWNYHYVFKSISGDVPEGELEDVYLRFLKKAHISEYGEFQEHFFAERKKRRETDRENWLIMNQPYPFLFFVRDELFPVMAGRMAVVSTKDELTILELLNYHGAGIKSTDVHGRNAFEKSGGKRLVVQGLMEASGSAGGVFIDDSEDHLSACEGIPGLRLVQNDWGYNAGQGVWLKNYDQITRGLTTGDWR